ncbi:GPI ethanolamine phosphate transferase 2 [Ceratocystis lukuohia]|uniref:GPI ethanolamine phosphate transferase 2 n=1 Tax=Ceratocystis lukuohia TaxID=2019550 RepID=A0ABR4MG11_9PEZI
MQKLLLVLANFLVLASLALFGLGFFPYKPLLSGLALYDELEYGPPPEPQFDRLVFMVVDALRSDFVYAHGSGFEFTHELIRNGAAVPFTANARSPTVTMPRLKALTTGSIPSFLDVILNVLEGDKSSALTSQDNWLLQMKAKNTGKMIMFGDDTWMKLFPDTFDREDGTTSFFVADYTIVDNNVTRHIPGELQNDDWNSMILHYLGLDHIGHKSGPNSANMIPKQAEMDAIVKAIYTAIETQAHLSSTLFVVCGDHGMNEAGNHGASSAGETSPALVFISPKFRNIALKATEAPLPPRANFRFYDYVEQSDLVPTLAALLGFPVPKNSLGVTIPYFLSLWEKETDQAQVLIRNAGQILTVITAAFGDSLLKYPIENRCSDTTSGIELLACRWQRISSQAKEFDGKNRLDQKWITETIEWLRDAQDLMSNMASNFKMDYIFCGLAVGLAAVVISGIDIFRSTKGLPVALLFGTSFLYGAMMFGSSFVEEEQHFWYWTTSLWLAYLGRNQLQMSLTSSRFTIIWLVSILSMLRLLRGWNQTGQKFAGGPDIVTSFLKPFPVLLWLTVLASISFTGFQLSTRVIGFGWKLQDKQIDLASEFASVITLGALSFKLAITTTDSPELVLLWWDEYIATVLDTAALPQVARTLFILIAGAITYIVYRRQSYSTPFGPCLALHHMLTFFLIIQSRVTNIPLFLFMSVIFELLRMSNLGTFEISLTTMMLQYASFFAFGGTNAISSIDLSSGYNGVTEFNIAAVGVLTFASNLGGPIFWASACAVLLAQGRGKGSPNIFKTHVQILTFFTAVSAMSVMAAFTKWFILIMS